MDGNVRAIFLLCQLAPLDRRDLEARLRPVWDSGQVLRAWLGVEDLFPLAVPLDAEAVNGADLEAGCLCATGQGYRIEYQGSSRRPCRVVFDRPLDLAAFLGELPALGEFARQARRLRRRLPGLAGWIREHPQRVLDLAPHWPELVAWLEQRLAVRPGSDDSTEQGRDVPDRVQQALLKELLGVLRAAPVPNTKQG